MHRTRLTQLTVGIAIFLATGVIAIQHQTPPGTTHEQHLAQMKKETEMKKRGSAAMGFDQDKSTHHFFLTRDGGVIQVETNAAADTTTRDSIRTHLKAISERFAKGDFRAPLMTHNEVPPGVSAIRRLNSEIVYAFEEKPQGALVRISSTNGEAIKAVHAFLRYQIKEHATGDPANINTE